MAHTTLMEISCRGLNNHTLHLLEMKASENVRHFLFVQSDSHIPDNVQMDVFDISNPITSVYASRNACNDRIFK